MDTDINVELKPYLEAVGFDVLFALHVGVNVTSDTAVVRWARRHRRIVVCHDKYADKATRLELFPEVHNNGGRIIRVSGDSSQDLIGALGKITSQRERWLHFFAENEGMVVVHSNGIRYMPREKLMAQVQATMEFDTDKLKQVRPSAKKKAKRRSAPAEQTSLQI